MYAVRPPYKNVRVVYSIHTSMKQNEIKIVIIIFSLEFGHRIWSYNYFVKGIDKLFDSCDHSGQSRNNPRL